jgi:hypothetical protein
MSKNKKTNRNSNLKNKLDRLPGSHKTQISEEVFAGAL